MTHKDFLFIVLDILEANKVDYTLFAGTLLGAVRDKGFLPGDIKDTDIALDDKDYWKVRYLFNEAVNGGTFKWYSMLRKEFSVADNLGRYKVDLFFMEKIEDNYAVYSYKPNPVDKRWNHEWRAWFPYEAFFPSIKIDFLGRQVSVPKDYERVLEVEYGDWRTPKPEWVSSDNTVLNVDKDYKGFYPAGIPVHQINTQTKPYEFAFICVNILRKESTKTCIKTLQSQYPNCKIYIADQDKPTTEMLQFYEANNVEYYFVPYDIGLSWCRNMLIEQVKEPYIMWGDNDFEFDSRSNIQKGITLLEQIPEIGIVGGCVLKNEKEMHYERILFYSRKYQTLIYLPLEYTNPEPRTYKNIIYYDCDLTFNYAIAKIELFKDNPLIRWNPKIKVRYEHSCFFLRVHECAPQYQVVYCPDMKVIHNHPATKDVYSDLRFRAEDGEAFAKDWNLKMNFTIGEGREIYGKELTKEVNLPKMEINYKKSDSSQIEFQNLYNEINKHNLKYCLIRQSCLNLIKFNRILLSPLVLAIDMNQAYEWKELLIKTFGYQIMQKHLIFKKSDYTVILLNEFPKNVESYTINSYELQIPENYKEYLKSLFGDAF